MPNQRIYIPEDISKLLRAHEGKLYLAGGYLRDTFMRLEPSDIDLFMSKDTDQEEIVKEITTLLGCEPEKTINAYTWQPAHRIPVQLIVRWRYDQPAGVLASFDFTNSLAAVWYSNGDFKLLTGDGYWKALATKTLVWAKPANDPSPGGALLRIIKFAQRGWHISLQDLAEVVSAFVEACDGYEVSDLLDRLVEIDPINRGMWPEAQVMSMTLAQIQEEGKTRVASGPVLRKG